ncbi:MAG: thioredoxin [Betaproteobacteria bacterium]|jgi:thioredoxin-related protein|nr:MAG: thioredoxin [Betaproteobacteria bacterium]
MRAIGIFVCGLMAWLATPAWAEVRDPQQHFFQQKFGELNADLVTAKQEGKRGILLEFEMEECPFCERMKKTVLNQSQVQDYFRQHFLVYSIDVRGDTPLVDFAGKATTEKAFALEQRARATPVFIFFDLDGQVMTRFTGATHVEDFLLLGRYVVEGHYKTLPFNAFKRQPRP